jgi:3-dehydroquinate synthetase
MVPADGALTIDAPSAGRRCTVTVGERILGGLRGLLPPLPGAERAFVVLDPGAEPYLAPLTDGLAVPALPLVVPAGVEAKSLRTAETLYEHLAIQEAGRDDVVVALGGGSTADIAGYVAATYRRGVRFIQVATTLTAQADPVVGGRVGVDLPRGPDLVGASRHPVAVLSDVSVLASLPDRVYRSGLAQLARCALALRPSLLPVLEGGVERVLARDPSLLVPLVAECVRAKASIVAEPDLDGDAWAVLDYGQTVGRALRRLDPTGVSHGEALATGMVFAARLAEGLGIARPGLVGTHLRLLAALGLPHGAAGFDPGAVTDAIRLDEKYRRGPRFVLLEDVGAPRLVEVPAAEVARFLAVGP